MLKIKQKQGYNRQPTHSASELSLQETETRVYIPLVDESVEVESIPDMFLPGKLIHIRRKGDDGEYPTSSVRQEYHRDYVVEVTDCMSFNEIVLSSFMGVDHLPNRLAQVLEEMMV